MSLKANKQTLFNKNWLLLSKYDWLREVKSNPYSAYCALCEKVFNLSNMGQRALSSHMEGKKHISIASSMKGMDRQTSMLSYCKTADSQKKQPETSQNTFTKSEHNTISDERSVTSMDKNNNTLHVYPSSSKMPQPAINSHLASIETKKAEILWAIKCVLSHLSYNMNSAIGDLFKTMFHDSEIAKHFTLGPTKLSYLVCFGIAPYFHEKLVNDIRSSHCFVISFDESLNKICQEEQMDLIVRYIDGNHVTTRYFGSQFLGHTTAKDLVDAFKKGTSQLNPSKMLQVSMDGPSTNFKFLELLVKDRHTSDPGQPSLLEVGSCALHVVHGALRHGIKKSGWNLEKLLRSLFYLFHDSPARREDFICITKTEMFPKPFCGTRWLDDVPVAQRAIEIWPAVVQYVTETSKKPRSKIPSCESYKVISVAAMTDPLITAKLECFVSVAKQLEPFLKKFQTDWPMMTFLGNDLELLLRTLSSRVVKADKMVDATSATKLLNIDVTKEVNLIPSRQTDIGFGAKSILQKIPQEKVNEGQKLQYFNEARQMIIGIIEKISERSPLKYTIIRSLISLDPRYIVSHQQSSSSQFSKVLQKLDDINWLQHSDCDSILAQYKEFAAVLCRDLKVDCECFNETITRLDFFYTETVHLHQKRQFAALWKIFQMVFTLSHGQASIERGFSVNKDILAPNLKKESLTAQRLVHNALTSNSIKDPSNFCISPELLKSCSHASSRYKAHLEEQKKINKDSESNKKKKVLEDELEDCQIKKRKLEKTASSLLEDADKKAKEAEKKQDFTLLASSNALRKAAKQKLDNEIPALDKIILELNKCIKS